MTPIRSQSSSTSPTSVEATARVPPSSAKSRSRSWIWRWPPMSTPWVGSSIARRRPRRRATWRASPSAGCRRRGSRRRRHRGHLDVETVAVSSARLDLTCAGRASPPRRRASDASEMLTAMVCSAPVRGLAVLGDEADAEPAPRAACESNRAPVDLSSPLQGHGAPDHRTIAAAPEPSSPVTPKISPCARRSRTSPPVADPQVAHAQRRSPGRPVAAGVASAPRPADHRISWASLGSSARRARVRPPARRPAGR